MFDRFLVFIFFLGFSLYVCTVSTSSVKCNKFHKTFSSPNLILPTASEINFTQCEQQCFGYACYNKQGEYIIGSGCKNEFFEACSLKPSYRRVIDAASNVTSCLGGQNVVGLRCTATQCNNRNNLVECIKEVKAGAPKKLFGPNKHISDITFK